MTEKTIAESSRRGNEVREDEIGACPKMSVNKNPMVAN